MKNILLTISMLVCLSIGAADYTGTLQMSGGYTLENVRVTIDEQSTLILHRVKFARLMPVRVDVVIQHIKRQAETSSTVINADNIVPLVDDKPYPNRLIRDLRGHIEGDFFFFRCKMGGKEMCYKGTLQRS